MSRPAPKDRVEARLCLALYEASHAMSAAYRALLDPLGLTYPQYIALSVLWQDGPTPLTQIAQRLGLESNTVSPMMKRLEARGLVERRRGQDERTVVVNLTDEGQHLGRQARVIPAAISAATGLSRDQERTLVEHLHTLAERLRIPT